MYAMAHPNFIVCSFMENSFGLKKVKWLQEGAVIWALTTGLLKVMNILPLMVDMIESASW